MHRYPGRNCCEHQDDGTARSTEDRQVKDIDAPCPQSLTTNGVDVSYPDEEKPLCPSISPAIADSPEYQGRYREYASGKENVWRSALIGMWNLRRDIAQISRFPYWINFAFD